MNREQELRQLLREGLITEYSLTEKWYKPTNSDEEVRKRWKEIVDEEVEDIRSINCSIGLAFHYPYVHGNYGAFKK